MESRREGDLLSRAGAAAEMFRVGTIYHHYQTIAPSRFLGLQPSSKWLSLTLTLSLPLTLHMASPGICCVSHKAHNQAYT